MSDLVLSKNQQALSLFTDGGRFDMAQRAAAALAASTLVPTDYRGNVSNCLIALELANRMEQSPFMVMQNMVPIQGRPSWSSTFIIASMNSCGRFDPLEFEFEKRGKKKVAYKDQKAEEIEDIACRAVTVSKLTGKPVFGTWVSMEMAVLEGWYTKAGSKWKTMPDQMLQYRAAAFFGRLHAPDILMGMQTADELYDISSITDSAPAGQIPKAEVVSDIDKMNQNIGKKEGKAPVVKKDPKPEPDPEPDPLPDQTDELPPEGEVEQDPENEELI